jgi:formylglycine-generating enzyme
MRTRTGIAIGLLCIAANACSHRQHSTQHVREADVSDGGSDASTTQSSFPVPVRPTPSEFVQPGTPVNLAPSADCAHPTVHSDCSNGFCRIPPGCFVMGAARDRPEAAMYADVQVQVSLTHAFEIGETEVTNAEWTNAGFDIPLRDVDVARCLDPECPVTNINFYEALTFLNRESEKSGLKPCYELTNCTGTFGSGPICNRVGDEPGSLDCERKSEDGLVCDGPYLTEDTPYACEGFRLPTEAEWEYSARAGTRWATWLGNIAWQESGAGCVDDNPNLDPIAWYCANAGGKTQHVKHKWANPWGIFDILGNVSEWTNTTVSYSGYGDGPLVDPVGYWYNTERRPDRNLFPFALEEGEIRRQDSPVKRGGNVLFEALSATTEKRASFGAAHQGSSVVGFRMVRTIKETQQ